MPTTGAHDGRQSLRDGELVNQHLDRHTEPEPGEHVLEPDAAGQDDPARLTGPPPVATS
jgi:hypothetical protein